MRELKTLEQLSTFVKQQRFKRQGGFTIEMQLEAIAMLIPGTNR